MTNKEKCSICGSSMGIVLFCEVNEEYEHAICHRKYCIVQTPSECEKKEGKNNKKGGL